MEALGAVPAYLTKKIQVAVLHESFTSQSKTSAVLRACFQPAMISE